MQKKKTLSCLQDNVFLIVFQWPPLLRVSSTVLPCFRARWFLMSRVKVLVLH